MKHLLPVFAFLLIITACSKDGNSPKVEFYLLKTAQRVQGKCQIDPAGSILEKTSLVKNGDIEWYDDEKHEFKLSAAAIQRINALKDNQALALTVNKEVIYYTIYKPMYSSSSCDNSITMDLHWPHTDQLLGMDLGYPGGGFTSIEDKRNDSKLLLALEAQNKLK